jgi:hypothetical protein
VSEIIALDGCNTISYHIIKHNIIIEYIIIITYHIIGIRSIIRICPAVSFLQLGWHLDLPTFGWTLLDLTHHHLSNLDAGF